MKIIVKNEKEKQEVLRACKYIHDFSVYITGISKKTKISINDGFSIEKVKPERGNKDLILFNDLSNYSILNFLAGLSDCDDKSIIIKDCIIIDENEEELFDCKDENK